jgi:hypothetical protein
VKGGNMNIAKYAYLPVVLSTLLVLFSSSCNGNPPITQTHISDPYIYPVQPDTPEWSKLTSLDEKIAACQVPEDILKRLTTKALVDTVLSYPLMGNNVFYYDPQSGLEENFAHANCVQELCTRQDAATELLTKYQWMLPVTIDELWSYSIKMQYTLNLKIIETLWDQKLIIDKVTQEQNKAFNRAKEDKYRTQIKFF